MKKTCIIMLVCFYIQQASAQNNTWYGTGALHSNTTGDYNSAFGKYGQYYNTTGNRNSSTGYAALYSNTSGNYNTANGMHALYSNTTGDNNTANGYDALFSNTTGDNNAANGIYALNHNTTGYSNTANGPYALFRNTTGIVNTANGLASLYENTTGSYNTATGYAALKANTIGYGNTASGDSALVSNKKGNYNTAIGFRANVSKPNFHNSTAVGYNSLITASNQVRIGNNSVSSIGGKVKWTTLSDGRVKTNIKPNVPGLAFINKLKPVTYNVDLRAAGIIIQPTASSTFADAAPDADPVVHSGFVAQEVEKAAKELNYDFDGVDAPKSDNDLYGLRYSGFVVPLVKAVQELSGRNDILTAEVEDLKAEIAALKSRLTAGSDANTQLEVSLSSSALQQNVPNPFANSTTIPYSLPGKFSSAKIVVTDRNGKTLKQFSLSGKGKGTILVDASTLASGAYHYALYVDGRLIDGKQMIAARGN